MLHIRFREFIRSIIEDRIIKVKRSLTFSKYPSALLKVRYGAWPVEMAAVEMKPLGVSV